MTPRHKKLYKLYTTRLSRNRTSFVCPQCPTTISPKDFERHCTEAHGLNSKTNCVWCRGKASWSPRKKTENSGHLSECFREFIRPYEIAEKLELRAKKLEPRVANPVQYKLVPSVEPMCSDKSFFDHESHYVRNCLPPEALKPFNLLEVEPPPVPFDKENVNLAASYVHKYLNTQNTHEWFHAMVRAVAFESFFRLVRNDENCKLLEFSCWCDGGHYPEAKHRQHRHMVVVAPKEIGFKSKIWSKVDIAPTETRPCPNYPVKNMRRIESPLHLVHTLGYLSKRKSSCDFMPDENNNDDDDDKKKKKKKNKKVLKKNHFYIFKALPYGYHHPLALLWKDDLKNFMYREHFQRVSINEMARLPLEYKHSQWRLRIGDCDRLPKGLVMDVDRNYVPARQITPHYFHLLNGRKLYFERAEETKDWFERQIRGGNSFYKNLSGEWWIPNRNDQEKLNLVMPREFDIKKLKMENERERIKNEELTRQLANANIEKEKLKLENEFLQQKFVVKNEEIEKLNAKISELENKHEKIIYNTVNCTNGTINNLS